VIIAGPDVGALPGSPRRTPTCRDRVPILGKSSRARRAALAVQMPPGIPVACVGSTAPKTAASSGPDHHA